LIDAPQIRPSTGSWWGYILIASKATTHFIPGYVDPFNVMFFPDVILKHREYFGRVSFSFRAPQNGDDFHVNSPFYTSFLSGYRIHITFQILLPL
jgi:hypothetical protein